MSNELAEKAKEAGLVVARPAVIEGMDGIDDKELKIGSVVLVQKGTDVFISKGIPAGELVNTAFEAVLANREFIPVYMSKVFSLYDNSGVTPKWVATSKNENDPIFDGKLRASAMTTEHYAKKLKPEVLPVIFVVALNDGQPIKIAFKKASGYYAGKDLYTLARKANVSLWGMKYKLGSKLIPASSKGLPAYHALTVEVVGPTTAEEQAYAKQLNASFQAKPVAADDSEVPF